MHYLLPGEHLTDEYEKNVNRFKKIPAIVVGDFKLAESIAIYRYLASEYKIQDNWYPKDSKKRARVDEYLEWQHVSVKINYKLRQNVCYPTFLDLSGYGIDQSTTKH